LEHNTKITQLLESDGEPFIILRLGRP